MESSSFEQHEDSEKYECFYGLEKDESNMKFKLKYKKWYETKTAKVLSAAIVAFILLYFIGNWVLLQFNYLMALFNTVFEVV